MNAKLRLLGWRLRFWWVVKRLGVVGFHVSLGKGWKEMNVIDKIETLKEIVGCIEGRKKL